MAARMEESEFSANAYDKVYGAERPEIFFKATAGRCVGSGGVLRLRDDSQWMVPEPELALVVGAKGKVVGFTIGDDLSCRDIEGENLLYLPQAKIWEGCCALGPRILINDGSVDIRRSSIRMVIRRKGIIEFAGATELGRMKRSFEELVGYLFRNQKFPVGVVLLTGTGIVPPEGFTLKAGDEILMEVEGIGELGNTVG
jgi:2-dehydro-3-deoxy-D-arabinonate dehydratase